MIMVITKEQQERLMERKTLGKGNMLLFGKKLERIGKCI